MNNIITIELDKYVDTSKKVMLIKFIDRDGNIIKQLEVNCQQQINNCMSHILEYMQTIFEGDE